MTMLPESSRERFLRNHQEDIHLMRIARTKAEREGRHDDALRIGGIIKAWECIADKVRGGANP